jgi:hypothetical protein
MMPYGLPGNCSKPPRFTKCGQEPNGIKLSPYWPDIAKVLQCKYLNLYEYCHTDCP